MAGEHISVDAIMENLEVISGKLEEYLDGCGCSMKDMMNIGLAVEEVYVNIVNYAYQGKTGKAEMTLSESDGTVTITISDSGVPFNPLEKDDPDITLSSEKRAIGGLGIFLVKKTMDSVSYFYENNKNILVLKKKIG